MICLDIDCCSKLVYYIVEYELFYYKRNLLVEVKCFWLSFVGGLYGIMMWNLLIYWILVIFFVYCYFVNFLWKLLYVVILFFMKLFYYKFCFFIVLVFVFLVKLKIRLWEWGWIDINYCEVFNDLFMFVCGCWWY